MSYLKKIFTLVVTGAILSSFVSPVSLPLSLSEVVVPAIAASSLMPFGTDTLTLTAEQKEATFVSPVFHVPPFYGAQVSWKANYVDENAIQIFIKDNEGNWLLMAQDIDAVSGVSLPVMLGLSEQVEIQVVLERINNKVPVLTDIYLSLVDPGKETFDILQANADETVILRKSWGADESLRLRTTRAKLRTQQSTKSPDLSPSKQDDKPPVLNKPDEKSQPTEADEYGPNCSLLEAKYPQEVKVGNVIRTNPSGEEYTWPIAYTTKLRKIVVHHTDMIIKDYDQSGSIDDLDYRAAVRAIYYFHTISRDWGDIGYNYLIDPAGHIYEGRAGGDLAIAAHSLCKNNGSLGIALLGEFNNNLPTEAALISLQSLIKSKGIEHNIDINGNGMFFGNLLPNVVGHRDVRATNCPGDRLYEMLPQLRLGNLTELTKIIFPISAQELPSSSVVSAVPQPVIAETKKTYKSSPLLNSQTVSTEPGEIITLNIQFRNDGNTIWNADTMVRPAFLPAGLTLLKQAKQNEEMVPPQSVGTFLPQLLVDKNMSKSRTTVDFYVVPNGSIDLSSFATKVEINVGEKKADGDISLNGVAPIQVKDVLRKNLVAAQVFKSTDNLSRFIVEDIGGSPLPESIITDPLHLIRVKLSMPENSSVATSNSEYKLLVDNVTQHTGSINDKVLIIPEDQGLMVKVGKNIYRGKVVRLAPQGVEPIVTLENFNHSPTWAPSLNDNQYRGVMEWRVLNSKLTVINELPLEDYLKGLAEVSNTAPVEKQKVMAIIARSYALYYLTKDDKFPGQPYDLDDDPNVSQKYLGYGYEKRSPAFVHAVNETADKVVTYQGEVIKTPYFSKSDGYTRSAKEVWGWTHTPYLVSVPDPLCNNPQGKLSGHGVGLSGCGAEEAARRGYSAEHILGYYYPGTEVKAL